MRGRKSSSKKAPTPPPPNYRRIHPGGVVPPADRMLNESVGVAAVAWHLEVPEQTYHRWRDQWTDSAWKPPSPTCAGPFPTLPAPGRPTDTASTEAATVPPTEYYTSRMCGSRTASS